MKRWWLILALLLSVAVNLGVLAALALGVGRGGGEPWRERPRAAALERWARGPREVSPQGGTRHPGPPRELARLADRLGLEGEGRARFLELQRELIARTLETRRARRELEAQLRRELTAAAPDRGRIDQLLGQLGDAFLAQERALAQTVLESRALLDAEQERLYLEVLTRLRERAGHRHGR